jgi:hypothetical protein
VIIYAGDETQKGESASGVDNGSSSKDGQRRSSEDEGAVEMIRRYLAEKLGFYDDKKEISQDKVKVWYMYLLLLRRVC